MSKCECGSNLEQRVVRWSNDGGDVVLPHVEVLVCRNCKTMIIEDMNAYVRITSEKHRKRLSDLPLRLYEILIARTNEESLLLVKEDDVTNPETGDSLSKSLGVSESDIMDAIEELWKHNIATWLKITNGGGNKVLIIGNPLELGMKMTEPFLRSHMFGYQFLNRSKSRDSSRKRLRKLKNIISDFGEEDKTDTLNYFDGKCAFTGKDVPIQWDHVIPVATELGGTTKANMLPIWQRINSSKCDRNVFEWFEKNAERFDVCPERFRKAIDYIAGLNDMTYDEYRDYVYECHAKANDKLTEVG